LVLYVDEQRGGWAKVGKARLGCHAAEVLHIAIVIRAKVEAN